MADAKTIPGRLAAYYGTQPRHVADDLRNMIDHGVTGVVYCLTETDNDLFPGNSDAGREWCERLGLRFVLNLWGFGGRFATTRMPSKYLCINPSFRSTPVAAIANTDDEVVGTPRGCLRNERFLAWTDGFVREAMGRLAPHEVFWDEPKDEPCACERCLAAYNERYGEPFGKGGEQKLAELHYDDMVGYLHHLFELVKETDAGCENSVCTMAPTRRNFGPERCEQLASSPALDFWSVSAYWHCVRDADMDWLRETVSGCVETCKRQNKRSLIWVQCLDFPAGAEETIPETVREVAKFGVDAISAWAFMGSAGCNDTCEKPERAWGLMGAAYRELAGGGVSA